MDHESRWAKLVHDNSSKNTVPTPQTSTGPHVKPQTSLLPVGCSPNTDIQTSALADHRKIHSCTGDPQLCDTLLHLHSHLTSANIQLEDKILGGRNNARAMKNL